MGCDVAEGEVNRESRAESRRRKKITNSFSLGLFRVLATLRKFLCTPTLDFRDLNPMIGWRQGKPRGCWSRRFAQSHARLQETHTDCHASASLRLVVDA